MISVALYHKSVPAGNKSLEKADILKYFSQGVTAAGDQAIDVQTYQHQTTDVAVIQGWVAPGPVSGKHTELRRQVIDQQRAKNKYTVAVDSNLFLYANTKNPDHYLRYSFNGVFPNTGIYCDNQIDPDRWKKISAKLNLRLRDYRKNGDHVLLCLQRNGGWSMGGIDIQDWANQTIATLRQHTNRPIVIRPHPGDKQTLRMLQKRTSDFKLKIGKNVRFSTNANLVDDLKNCWAAVNFNSSPLVGAAIEGYPVFVMDVDRSQCREIANTELSQIERPNLPDRQAWIERISMSHWNFDELKSGECWSHMRQWVAR